MFGRRLHPLAPFGAFAGVASALIIVHYLLPAGSVAQGLVYQAVGIGAVVAVVVGIVVHRPKRIAHLVLLAVGLALTALGNGIYHYFYFVLGESPYPSLADVAYLGGYAAYVCAIGVLASSRHHLGLSDLLDATIVLIGSGLLYWVLLIEPLAGDGSATVEGRVVSAVFPAFDVLLVVILAQLLTSAGTTSTAFVLFMFGVVALLLPDALYGIQQLEGTYAAGGWLDLGWMLSTSFWGLAALHPSVRSMHLLAREHDTRLTWKRLSLLAVASLIPPVLMLGYVDGDRFGILLVSVAATVTTLLVFTRMALLFREHGRTLVALRDVAAGAEAEQALHDSHERFESAATALKCAIYEWNRDSDTVRWTTGLGHESSGERPAEWWAEHVHPDDRGRLVQLEEHVHAGEREKESEYRFLRGDGTYAHVLDRWVATHDGNGDVVRAVGGMVDVTHQRALEARLQQSEKMEALGRLAGGVAHDFNNLLTAIIGNADLLLHISPADPGWQEDVAEITRAADRAADLTGQLLTFSRGRGSSDVSADLDRTVNEMATMVGRLLGTDVGIELILDTGSGHVACDPSQLEQVFLNLALNARDAMPEGGTLRIETDVVDHLARIVVSDTGIGMDEETAERIFEPFFTTKPTGKGTGLGLATVYGVVEQAGGSISVRTGVGEGTSFELLLPWSAAPETVAPRPGGARSAPGTGTILVVEDEGAVRAVVTRMLERSGYSVVPVSSPLDAVALLDDGLLPDLVLSDVVMPQLSGFALASRVKELHPDLPFLFITGFTGTDERPEGLESHPILRKPFTADQLVAAIGGVLESAVVPVP